MHSDLEEFKDIEALLVDDDITIDLTKKSNESTISQPLYVIPLISRPFFPGMAAPIVIDKGVHYEVLKNISHSEDKMIGLFLTKKDNPDVEDLKAKDLYRVGVLAKVLRIVPFKDGEGAQAICSMEKRIKVDKFIKEGVHLKAKVSVHHDKEVRKETKIIKALSIEIVQMIKKLVTMNPLFKEELQIFLSHSDFTKHSRLADFTVSLTTATRKELQSILEAFDLQTRLEMALSLLNKEFNLSKLQSNISKKIELNIQKSQREFFLKEQLLAIKKELGLTCDDKSIDMDRFKSRIEGLTVPEHALGVMHEELDKLNVLELQSPEYSICRSYLDWLTSVPWGVKSPDTNTFKKCKEILDRDHYGLKDIKERILEFISIGKLTGEIKGNILCLVGPPGVGKTSVGKSIAHALGREFYRFSVGGMRDEAEIKGHRRTYIGAMPGKMIQALKHTKAINPVIMLDEIDKIGQSYHGDPASSLLEVLDPEQNKDFLDHYLDVRVDLSDVIFIVTANVLDTIPDALRDRMDVLRLSGYIMEEKVEIAKKYLLPRHLKEMGLKPTDLIISNKLFAKIVDGYARDPGIRTLEKCLKRVLRKQATLIVKRKEKLLPSKQRVVRKLTESILETFLGKPQFNADRIYDRPPIGVVMGLAWTSMGGVTLYVEASEYPSKERGFKVTGSLGDVMKESCETAWTFMLNHVEKYFGGEVLTNQNSIHLHVPEGATPKDGPSAGVTMVTSMLSLYAGKIVRPNLAMTGEITLTGKVLPIGGVKEKIIAAIRSEVQDVILPEDNKADYGELPDYLKKKIKRVHFVRHYDEIYTIAFGNKKK